MNKLLLTYRIAVFALLLVAVGLLGWLTVYSYLGVQTANKNLVTLYNRESNTYNAMIDLNVSLRELRSRIDRLGSAASGEPEGGYGAEPKEGRILPDAHSAIEEVRDLLRKFDTLLDDVQAGRAGAHVTGSIWGGTADITLRRNP
jgi:hypothetical protein